MNATFDATLQQLVDRNEITDLVHRLGVVLDEGLFDDLRSLLAEGATVRTAGGAAEGHEAIIAQASRNHPLEQPLQHVITNIFVDLDGARAQARANLVVYFGPLAGASDSAVQLAPPVEYTMGEVYHYDLVRTSEGWRFSRIQTTPVWRSGTPFRPPLSN
jgi:SnoaL-like domain